MRAGVPTSLMALFACYTAACSERGEPLLVQKASAFLYSSVDACQWTARVGPDQPFLRPPKGIVLEIPPGTVLNTFGTVAGKDTACIKVTHDGQSGYVLGSCGRVEFVGRPCGGSARRP